MYVDLDFVGSWNKIDCVDRAFVLSRIGFVIILTGCPNIWVRRVQSEIALSTNEAEYIALSTAMREVIPLMALLEEFRKILHIQEFKSIVNYSVFEDNNGVIKLSKVPKMCPRTKHVAIKYHFFRDFVEQSKLNVSRLTLNYKLQIY